MFVVGLTGGIGAGKTTISTMFAKLGIEIVDTDLLAREVVEPGSACLLRIQEHFGDSILNPGGDLNRRKLREIIFTHAEEKTWLESLLHPAIRSLTRTKIGESQSSYTILSSPLLLESPDREIVNRVLIVDIPEALQLIRTTQRDAAQAGDIQKIVDSQMPREKRLALADDIIDNSQGIEHSESRVKQLHQQYLTLSQP